MYVLKKSIAVLDKIESHGLLVQKILEELELCVGEMLGN
jgi:hypothetical protein